MNITGIITEYNPFHNGHKLHIEKAREITGADYIVAVMSGNFVQRGEPAIMDKYLRTEIALREGVDLVIELPVPFSCASAEYFAGASISILNGLGCINNLVFGSECGTIPPLNEAADILLSESGDFKEALLDALKNGLSYPLAISHAAKFTGSSEISQILSQPNNLLGIEYIKAIKNIGSDITPYTFSRIGNYNSEVLSENYSSASAIRLAINNVLNTQADNYSIADDILKNLPEHAAKIMFEQYNKSFPICADDFTAQLFYKLLSETDKSFTMYADISSDIENRIKKALKNSYSFSSLTDEAKTKAFTRARISRGLVHILLNITEENMQSYKADDFATYARILGFRKESAPLLTEIKKNSAITLITKLAGFENILNAKDADILRKEIYASDLYEATVSNKYKRMPQANEFTRGVIII